MKLSERIRKERFRGGCAERAKDWADEVALLEADKGVVVVGDGLRVGVHFVENLMQENALLEAKLTAIECGDCDKNLLECKCDDEEE